MAENDRVTQILRLAQSDMNERAIGGLERGDEGAAEDFDAFHHVPEVGQVMEVTGISGGKMCSAGQGPVRPLPWQGAIVPTVIE